MATFQQKLPEGSRSPDTPARKNLARKICPTTAISTWHSSTTKRPYVNDDAKSLSEFNNNIFGVNAMVQDLNKNLQEPTRKTVMPTATNKVEKHRLKQSLPKLLCLKKSPSANYDELQTLNVNALREDYNSNKCSPDNSASSSQEGDQDSRKNRNSFHQNVEEALSSLLWQPYEYQNNSGKCRSLSSSSCSSPSSSSLADLDEITKNYSDDIAGTPTSHRCGFEDPHACAAATATEMVIHLPVAEDQSLPAARSREPSAQRSPTWLSRSLSLAGTARLHTYLHGDGASYVNGGDMQANGASPPHPVTQSTVFASTLNLSSANVVGLPGNHSRYASVPVQTRQVAFPNHSRNVSEPASQFLKFGNGNVVVPAHRHSSHQVDQSNLHQINNQLRSSSVPNSVPRHESSGTTASTTTVPSVLVSGSNRFNQKAQNGYNNNVSNVNVNFYKAVPVNVASSVPTIHCLNTVQGNDVSNVQVLPLGTNFSSPQSTISAGSSGNPSHVSGTTQVILHNTPEHANNRNTLLEAQVLPSSTSITNFLPPPPITTSNSNVIIQNARTMVSLVGATSPARTYTNAGINTVQVSTSTAPPPRPGRTFTSTEAQTDDISVLPPVTVDTREQRRRERRERRHHRRIANGVVGTHRESSTQVNGLNNDRLPDLLNSHLPPPYTPAPLPQPQNVLGAVPPPMVPPQMVPPPPGHPPGAAVLQTVVPNNIVPPSGFVYPPPPPVVSGQVPMVQGPAPVAVPVPSPTGFRFPFPSNGFRRGRFSEEPPKGCCGLLSWKPGSLRWFIALIALVAVCCVLVGTALGAMRPAGRDHLTVSLLMIGVGIVLVTVSGVAWRLTSHSASTCRSMLGLSPPSESGAEGCPRRFVPRLPPSYGRPHHPYAAMMYPEFQYRPPPPSYQASMQEYRLRLLLLDRAATPQIRQAARDAVSPPPTYRSHAGSLLRVPLSSHRDAAQSEYSCPPSYRSQNSTNRQGTLQSNSVLHSREQSLSLSESNHGGSVVNVVNILGSTEEDIALDNITLDSLKMEPESDIGNPVKMMLKGSSSDLEGSKDGNLVTIVQTNDQSPVIVTVSGSSQVDGNSSIQITEIPNEMEILAHL